MCADLLEPGAVAGLFAEARSALGPITVLVNNAAFTAPGRPPKEGVTSSAPKVQPAGPSTRADWPAFIGTPLGAFRRHFEINVFAAYELTQLAALDMLEAGVGAVVNITSGASRMPGDGPYSDRNEGVLPGYGGSKIALEHLTQCAAYELQDRNIAVNALSPSQAILTPGVEYYSHDFGDYGSAEDFAEAAVRLAVIDPSQVTGRTIGHLEVLDGSFRSFTHQ